ncbi:MULTISPECIES: citrate synthase [Pseudomonas]|uniref:citrate synthase (unknown stereospecificity) n=1 Tax=Pseudomonas citronellolis TaxID=53408 RepID=A0AAW6P8S7_9PSED|nr:MULTISPECIES: citrate synthase [Pseudomonas]KES23018.1 DNA-binding protein [Pseudomonas sp. AAC]MDF3843504.1 citrate synthase [Pseudomonas citronellolis]WAB91898.1 citrate synthase [Pseudomonas citronellolis]WBG66518.1 DNA-binding protein [Pseudomonas citronellolis]
MPTPEDDLYLSAEEAAGALGISLPTLYAYVSRKNIRSIKVEGSRSRKYWAADIERLRKLKPAAGVSGDSPSVGAQSSITLLTDKGLYYRGQDVTQLATNASVEAVAELMWQSEGAFQAPAPRRPKNTGALLKAVADLAVGEKLVALFPLLERENPRAHDLSVDGYARTGVDVVRWFAALLVGAAAPDDRPLHRFIAESLGVNDALADLIRQVLILSIDHELDPTTYSVRAAANTGITPYYAAIVGIASSRGRHLAYGRNESVARLLDDICTARNPADPVVQRFREDGRILGFGSNQHGESDPRATFLLQSLHRLFARDAEFRSLLEAAEVAEELTGQPMDFILLLTFIGRKLGLQGQEIALAGVGRAIGWIAHASEQYHQHPLLRPRARYTGTLPD